MRIGGHAITLIDDPLLQMHNTDILIELNLIKLQI